MFFSPSALKYIFIACGIVGCEVIFIYFQYFKNVLPLSSVLHFVFDEKSAAILIIASLIKIAHFLPSGWLKMFSLSLDFSILQMVWLDFFIFVFILNDIWWVFFFLFVHWHLKIIQVLETIIFLDISSALFFVSSNLGVLLSHLLYNLTLFCRSWRVSYCCFNLDFFKLTSWSSLMALTDLKMVLRSSSFWYPHLCVNPFPWAFEYG